MPWRNTDDAYAIYISEIMLQQTQVKTVLERFYFPFLKRFPTLASLACATRHDVLKAWQGLGYYTRALNLHQAAKTCAPSLPRSVDGLLALPGIGRNTAHAVAAFAFRQPVAVMEANVKRVLSRLFALEHPTDAQLWEKAALLLDDGNAFDYNQAMMDIGASTCTRRNPQCGACPAEPICRGRAQPELYPAPKRAKTLPVRARRIALLRNEAGEYYARPRATRFLQGLYHFIETDAQDAILTCRNRRHAFADGRYLGKIRQQYSHFILDAEIWVIAAGRQSGKYWHSLDALSRLPVSTAERKIIAMLEEPQL